MRNWIMLFMVLALALAVSTSARAENAIPLKLGQTAPDFKLPWADEDSLGWDGLRLSDHLQESPVVLLFYAANWSGGCTKAVCDYRDNLEDFRRLDVTVWGVSGDYIFSHREFAKQYRLMFPLLSDHDHSVAQQYGAFNEKTGFNKRSVFIIDTNQLIRYVDYDYDPSDGEGYLALSSALRSLRK